MSKEAAGTHSHEAPKGAHRWRLDELHCVLRKCFEATQKKKKKNK
jgi:hypothetical protein